MMDIRLQRLILQDFQGGTFTLDADSEDVSVWGANAAGKTRLASAWSWLLWSRDALGRADFEIKNLDAEGNMAHGLDHSVEALLQIDGTPTTLKKVYHEVWTKRRGSAKSELTGNTVDHFIDGVPTKENEYKARIAEIAGDEGVFRLLTSPTSFPALPWQKQRGLLLEVCGDISDADVIASDSALSPLTDLLKKYTVSKTPLDDLRRVVSGRRSEINKQIDQLPVRIDEVHRGLPDVTGLDREMIAAKVASLEEELTAAKLRLSGVDNGSAIAEISKSLAIINNDIQALELVHYNEVTKKVRALDEQIREIADKGAAAERKAKTICADMEAKSKEVGRLETLLSNLRAEWAEINAEAFQDGTPTTCPTCGQSLPSERVQEAREKGLADFNRRKAERLTEINERGRTLKTEQDRLKAEIETLNNTLILIPTYEEKESIGSLSTQRDALKATAQDYFGIEGHGSLVERKNALESRIAAEREGVQEARDVVQAEVDSLDAQLDEAKALAYRFTQREAASKRVEELKAEEKRLAKEFEDLERQLFLVESFIKRKVALLSDRVNSKFEFTRFRLFNELVNGGIEQTCVATKDGVPLDAGLNSGGRTQVGCDIVRTLQEHFGLRAPLFVDNRESVTEIPAMKCQVVNLIVSPADKTLRVVKSR